MSLDARCPAIDSSSITPAIRPSIPIRRPGSLQKAWMFVAVWPYSARVVRRSHAHADLRRLARCTCAGAGGVRRGAARHCAGQLHDRGEERRCATTREFNRSYCEFAEHYSLAVLPARVKTAPRQGRRGKWSTHGRASRARRTSRPRSSSASLSSTGRSPRSSPRSTPSRSKSARAAGTASSKPRSGPLAKLCRRAATNMPSGKSAPKCIRTIISRSAEPTTRCITRLIGQRVDARLVGATVEIFQRGALIATHPRATRRYQRLTIEAHRPPEHRAYLALGIDRLLARAEAHRGRHARDPRAPARAQAPSRGGHPRGLGSVASRPGLRPRATRANRRARARTRSVQLRAPSTI